MNIGSFQLHGQSIYGVFGLNTVSPASESLQARYRCLRDLLDDGALDMLKDSTNLSTPVLIDDIKFLPPIPNPRKIICVGMNYIKPYPVDGVPPPNPENIILFGKERDTLLGHLDSLEIPKGEPENSFDYEGEIAVVIGKLARDISVDDALDYVLGYSIFNDGSVREWQKHTIYAGKNFANSGAWGPWITTADALPPVEKMELNVSLNGQMVQSAFGHEMIFSLAQQVSYVSSLFTLRPGDVIATGSPDGAGGSRKPKRYLQEGDAVSMSVTGIGTLSNRVVANTSTNR